MSTSELDETCEEISTGAVETIEAPGHEQNAVEERLTKNKEGPADTLGNCIVEAEKFCKEQNSAASSEENGLDEAVSDESENHVELQMSEGKESNDSSMEIEPAEIDKSDKTEPTKPSEKDSSSDEEVAARRPVYNFDPRYCSMIINKILLNENLRVDQRLYWRNYIFECYRNGKLWSNSYMFHCRVDRQTSYKFTGGDFAALAVDNQQLIGNVLDLVIGYHCRNLPINYVETTATEVLRYTREGMPSPFEKEKNFVMAVFNLPLNEYCAHWIFFMFDKMTRCLYVIDPFYNVTNHNLGNCLLQWFTEIHHGKNSVPGSNKSRAQVPCDPRPEDWNFTDYDWSIKCIPHTLQKDPTSCGLFCIEFSQAIVSGYPHVPNFIHVDEDLGAVRERHTAKFLELAERADQ